MKRFIMLLLAGALLCSCTTGTSQSGLISSEKVDSTDPRILVVYSNEEFKDKPFVVRKMMDNTGPLSKCSVTVQNTSNDTFIVEYQFKWMEEGGMPIMQTPAWSRLTLPPGAVKPLISVGKVREAKVVEFTLRLPLTELYLPPKEK